MKKIMASLIVCLMLSGVSMADVYQLEPTHTYASFKVKHFSRSMMSGVFTEVTGKLVLDEPGKEKVDLSILVNSLNTYDEKRDQHLLSPDYLNAKRYKTMDFESTKIEKLNDEKYKVTGKLTLHGKTREVTADATRGITGKDPYGNYRTGGNIHLKINRRDFGITHMPDNLVGDIIDIDLEWEALREED